MRKIACTDYSELEYLCACMQTQLHPLPQQQFVYSLENTTCLMNVRAWRHAGIAEKRPACCEATPGGQSLSPDTAGPTIPQHCSA